MIVNDTKLKDQTADKKVEVKPAEVVEKTDEKTKTQPEVKKVV